MIIDMKNVKIYIKVQSQWIIEIREELKVVEVDRSSNKRDHQIRRVRLNWNSWVII